MPAVSKAQQRFMGMVHAADKGETPASPEVAKVSASMKDSDAKDFASTKHKGLPDHVKEVVKEIVRDVLRAEGAFGSVIGGAEDARNLTEMSPNDVHFKTIIKLYDRGGSFTKKKVGVVISRNPKASRNTIIDDLKDMDYHEILDAEDELGIKEIVEKRIAEQSVNEGKKAFKVNPGIGKAKYSISSHDGKKKHNDGSDFWDIEIFKNKVDLEKAIKKYTSNGFVKESVNEGLSKDAIVRTLTSDKNAYFLTKDGNGWILDITPKGAQHSTFHQKFTVKDMGKGHLGMKYKLTESHDCGCNENHDCGCGGLHEHHINEDVNVDANGIAGLTASRANAVKDFIEKHKLDSNKLYQFLKKGGLKDKMDFVTALVGKPNNPIQTKLIKQFSK
jgi:hypothetical protein